jgi:hypothetical protein
MISLAIWIASTTIYSARVAPDIAVNPAAVSR